MCKRWPRKRGLEQDLLMILSLILTMMPHNIKTAMVWLAHKLIFNTT
jgi:hypothetical protein